jgi:hypothetical protein
MGRQFGLQVEDLVLGGVAAAKDTELSGKDADSLGALHHLFRDGIEQRDEALGGGAIVGTSHG